MKRLLFIAALFLLIGCTRSSTQKSESQAVSADTIAAAVVVESSFPKKVGEIPLPNGFERLSIEDTMSFAYYLRNLPLKPEGSPVLCYDGSVSQWSDIAYAVIDGIDVSDEDIQQCADAIIRLRAEWLYKNKRYDEIAFHFTNGWLCEYKRWAEGERVKVEGNKTSWYRKYNEPDYSYATFRQYLREVFMYAGTLSLSKELNQTGIRAMQIGDVFIEGGSPGHAIIVVDVANEITGEHKGNKCFLVAESYMPAQEIHIIPNPNMYRENVYPWHLSDDVERSGDYYNFWTWKFSSKDIKRF